MEKEMATHCSTLAWRIPRTEPGELQFMGLQRVGHDCTTNFHFHRIPKLGAPSLVRIMSRGSVH